MSILMTAVKRKRFLKKANENKANIDKLLQLKKEVFGEIKPKDLENLLKNGGIDDFFYLKLIEYAESYHEFKLQDLAIKIASNGCDLSKANFAIELIKNAESEDDVYDAVAVKEELNWFAVPTHIKDLWNEYYGDAKKYLS